jgi:hypothetical protein
LATFGDSPPPEITSGGEQTSTRALFFDRGKNLFLIFDDGVENALILQDGALVPFNTVLVSFDLVLIGDDFLLVAQDLFLIGDDIAF